MMPPMPPRRLPLGAEPADGGAHFRVWAPQRRVVEVVLENGRVAGTHRLERTAEGHFAGWVDGAAAGDRYRYRLDGDRVAPDPASRFQPEGPHGPSQLVDPAAFRWSDDDWHGPDPDRAVLYELHVGTFSADGTWQAAMTRLPALAELGITVIEMMPVAEFTGDFGWGYDGVNLFAPYHGYGRPDDLRRFVDRAHAHGIAVILDVVCNHYGPDGNYLAWFSDHYIGTRRSEWGDTPNFDGPHSAPVRAMFAANAGYWIDEFRFDGLRLDATQQIFDDSPEHVLRSIVRSARAAARGRRVFITAENEPQRAALLAPQALGGGGCDAMWNDDFHHSARVALTGRRDAYYSDHRGTPQELLSALKHGFLFQGQHYAWQRAPRGSSSRGIDRRQLVHFIENHDQVANSLRGERLASRVSPAQLRAMTAVLLLGPQTPLLFQGQEYGSTRPFVYFADMPEGLVEAVCGGRFDFLSQFPGIAAARDEFPNPCDRATFEACRLDHAHAVPPHAYWWQLHRDLLALRRSDPTLLACHRHGVDGAVLGRQAWVLRLFGARAEDDRLLLVNLGSERRFAAIAEPLLAPAEGWRWRLQWSSEAPDYGGTGVAEQFDEGGWRLPGHCALLLFAVPQDTAAIPRSLVGHVLGDAAPQPDDESDPDPDPDPGRARADR